MLRPEHNLKAFQQSPWSLGRYVSVGLVAAIHVAFIYVLATGLASNMIAHITQDVQVAVIKEAPPPNVKPPPPPPPDFKVPPPDFVPPPDINIATTTAPANAITVQHQAPVAPPPPKAVAQVTPPKIRGRHDVDQCYPPLSRRLNEEGTAVVKFTVSATGDVSDTSIAKSSGYSRLDKAAQECVQRWHYTPGTKNGQPSVVATEVAVKFQLTGQ